MLERAQGAEHPKGPKTRRPQAQIRRDRNGDRDDNPLADDTAHQATAIHDERLQIVVADLQKRGASRPRKVATLRNTINAVFQNKLPEEDLALLVTGLQALGYVTVDDTKVTYALPLAAG